MKTLHTQTWLPIFPGFYGTILEIDEQKDWESIKFLNNERINNNIPIIDLSDNSTLPVESIDFDYSGYMNEMAKEFTEPVKSELIDAGIIKNLWFENLHSPREYNFHNDSINVTIHFSPENIKHIHKLIYHEHWKEWNQYLKEKYTGCDGFIPFYSNNPKDWLIYSSLQDDHKAGAILDFICEYVLELNGFDILERIEHVELEIKNFDSLIDFENIKAYPENYFELSCLICGEMPKGHELRHSKVLHNKGESYICNDCLNNQKRAYRYNRENELIFW